MTISALGTRHGVARSTLLHYDKIGVLRPSLRSAKGYRLYSLEESIRLERICAYRRLGLSLPAIAHLLECPGDAASVLSQQMATLEADIERLALQHRLLALLSGQASGVPGQSTKEIAAFRERLLAAGFHLKALRDWHRELARVAPDIEAALERADHHSEGDGRDDSKTTAPRAAEISDPPKTPKRTGAS